MSAPYTYQTRVRFHDADPAGIAFFGKLFTWCHDAYEDFLREGGVALDELVKGDVGLPLASAHADFVRPLPHGAALTVKVECAEVKPKGFTLKHTVLGPDGEPAARVTTVHVAFSREAKRPVALPERITQLLSSISTGGPS